MADSPNLSHRKNNNDKNNSLSRRPSDFQSSPMRYWQALFSYEESEGRSNYPNLQPQLQERKIFGFEIYIDNDILT